MKLNQVLIAELQHEASLNNRVFERIPEKAFDWRPHDKSMSMVQLASHTAEIPSWVVMTVNQDELDFATADYKPTQINSVQALLEMHQKGIDAAVEALKDKDNEHLMQIWKMRHGDKVFFELPRATVIRNTIMNHMVHHRGQLTVYLRMNDVPLPSIYGPTADEPGM